MQPLTGGGLNPPPKPGGVDAYMYFSFMLQPCPNVRPPRSRLILAPQALFGTPSHHACTPHHFKTRVAPSYLRLPHTRRVPT